MTNFDKVGTFMKTFGQEVKQNLLLAQIRLINLGLI